MEAFLNVGNLALVNASFYPGLLLVFSVNLKKIKIKQKQSNTFVVCCCINFPPYHVTTILCSSFLVISWVQEDPPLYYYLRLSLFMFDVTPSLSPCSSPPSPAPLLLSNAQCLLWFALTVLYPFRYVLTLYRNNTEFVDRQIISMRWVVLSKLIRKNCCALEAKTVSQLFCACLCNGILVSSNGKK